VLRKEDLGVMADVIMILCPNGIAQSFTSELSEASDKANADAETANGSDG